MIKFSVLMNRPAQHMAKKEFFSDAPSVEVIGEDHIAFDDAVAIVGDGVYNGILFTADEIKKAYKTMDNQPLNLDHSERVEDEIGFAHLPRWENNRMMVTPFINKRAPKAAVAMAYINGRFAAGKAPEVSVGVWLNLEYDDENDEAPPVARDLQFDHLALVTRGACSPEDGCGIGMNNASFTFTPSDDSFNIEYNDDGSYRLFSIDGDGNILTAGHMKRPAGDDTMKEEEQETTGEETLAQEQENHEGQHEQTIEEMAAENMHLKEKVAALTADLEQARTACEERAKKYEAKLAEKDAEIDALKKRGTRLTPSAEAAHDRYKDAKPWVKDQLRAIGVEVE
jgi:hypothetical protein